MSFRAMTFGTLKQIRLPDARKRFNEGKLLVLCGSNMRPGPAWNPEYYLGPDSIAQWKEKAEYYAPKDGRPAGSLWKGDINSTAWALMINNYMANLSAEEGRYAVFYEDTAGA